MAWTDPITWDTTLPTVMQFGDSLAIRAHTQIKARLSGVANYWRPLVNCSHTDFHIENINRWWWAGSRPSLVQINHGLHDIVDWNYIDETQYESNLEYILGWWQSRIPQDCILLWANTTFVGAASADPGRTNANVLAYNAIAADVCDGLSIPVLDLHTLTEANYPTWYFGSGQEDDVHLSDDGYTAFADAIADDWAARLGWDI